MTSRPTPARQPRRSRRPPPARRARARSVGVIAIALLAGAAGVRSAGAASANPFGVMVGGGGLTMRSRVEVAKRLGVAYVRPWDLTLSDWGGFHQDTEAFQEAGFAIVLTVRNSGDRGPSGAPSKPPLDLARYEARLGSVLDKYKPALVSIEDEESSPSRFAGTPEQYAELLRAACAAAHARGVRCTNGGLPSKVVALLVAEQLRAQGQVDRADAFVERATSEAERRELRGPGGRERAARAVERGRALLAGYAGAKADFVNLHWDIPDAAAFEEAARHLSRATGLPVVSNELGQPTSDDDEVTAMLAAARRLGMPFVVWSSMDGNDRRGLQNPDGSLRGNGRAFAAFVRDSK